MKKGFTLIELLAVIVILAVIALIAVPIIMNMIEDSKRNAAIASANGYVRAVNYKIAQEILNNRTVDEEVDYVIGENELALTGTNLERVTGSYSLADERVLWAGLCINGYSVEYNATTGHTGLSETNYCTGGSTFVFEEPEAESMSVVCTDSSKYTSETAFKIKTVEDLVCFSNLVNSGKNFSGKNVYLLADIDITSDSSYTDPSTTAYGDINGNSTTEGLKTELTTGAGFKPIGNDSNRFSGTFDGYAFTIDHLMINRNTQYVGMFGYNTGVIRGIALKNVSITKTGNTSSTTGGLVGQNIGTVRSVSVSGTVTSSSSGAGGIIGTISSVNSSTVGKLDSSVFTGKVTADSTVAGLVGSSKGFTNSYKSLVRGVVYDAEIKATASSYKYANIYTYSVDYNDTSGRSKGVTGDASTTYDTSGWKIPAVTLEAVDGVLDTYIGGDNDSDGYYFDYDSEGNVALFATARNPIETNKLKGEGTEESPYLIRNEKDWKIASATVTQSKYYSVTSNIDFTNKKYYALGSNTNKFNGNINGNMNTISNISIYGGSYLGLFGYNEGTIEGFKFDNITTTGTYRYIGTLVGYNMGTIRGVEAKNITISSSNETTDLYVGGLVGTNKKQIKDVSVSGTITSTGTHIGGIIGSNESTDSSTVGKLESALFTGSITGKATVSGLVGSSKGFTNSYKSIAKGVVYDATLRATDSSYKYVNIYTYSVDYNDTSGRSKGVTGDVSTANDTNGWKIPAVTLEAVDGVLDTYIAGDNDSNGYYFDYDSSGNIALYSTAKTPITNTLAGTGTQADPYIIASADDWKIASSLGNKGKYFSVTSDIDFTNTKYYALGSNTNKFNGNINGNMHTISHVSIYGGSYLGLFGYNEGTIEGFVFDNITTTGTYRYIGTLVGYNMGTIRGIEAKNITISSSNATTDLYVGGLVGTNKKQIKDVSVSGTITSTGTHIGGIVGSNESTDSSTVGKLESAVFTGSITGKSTLSGLVGTSKGFTNAYKSIVKGVVYDAVLTATDSSYKYVNIYTYYVDYLETNGRSKGVTGDANSTYDSGQIAAITVANVSSVLDTTDSDNNKYYFGVCNDKLVLRSKVLTPIGTDACVVSSNTNPTYLGVVYLNPKNISQSCNAQNSVSTTGTKDGCMKFYIYKDDGTNYTMILDHNTTATVAWANQADFVEAGGDVSEWQTNEGSTTEGPVTANKQLASDTTGWSGNPRLITANEIAEITGANTSLSWNSSKTYANPVTDKSTQIGPFYFDGSGTNYSGWTSSVATSSNRSRYAWLYDNTNACIQYGCNSEVSNTTFGYWTSDSYNINYLWVVASTGSLGDNNVTNTSNIGVRPVITLPKTSVTVN